MESRTVITLNKDDDSNVESCCVTSDSRHPRVCLRKWRHMTRNGPFVSFCPFRPGFGLSGLVMGFLACVWPFWHSIITWLFAKKISFVFIHRTVNTVYKTVCRNCPISSCGAKYLVRLANHLADVHQLDHIQRRQYLQEAKLQPRVKVVVYESEADNPEKNSLLQSSTDTRNGVLRTIKITEKWSLF